MAFNTLKTYIREAQALRKEHPNSFSKIELVEFFLDWRRSLKPQFNPLSDRLPWITFPAIKFLKGFLKNDMRVFEYGTGGSTVFFAERVKEVISTEHDPLWLEKVSGCLRNLEYQNWYSHLIEPKVDSLFANKSPSEPDDYISTDEGFKGKSFQEYVLSIDQYPNQYFDLVLVDGRARPSCIKQAIPKIKPGGFLVLDNSDRAYYLEKVQTYLNDWLFLDFPGPCPYIASFSRTSAWKVGQ
jgi:hypothetical protein